MTSRSRLLAKWKKEKDTLILKEQIRSEREEILKNRKKRSTTKVIVACLFINCVVVEIFAMRLIEKLGIAEGIPALIAAVVTPVIGFLIYAYKSLKENTKGGIVYDSALKERKDEEEHGETFG